MAKKTKNDFSIVTINKPTERTFGLSNNEISIHDISKSNKKKFYISYIQYKDIMTTTVELPRDTAEADVPDSVAIKVYEDLGLDSALDYKITYMEATSSGDESRYFNVFVVNQNLISQLFEPVAKATTYIDYIALAPFLISGLYKRNMLPPDGSDCFIYLQRDDAFMVVYQNGEYFQSRSLRYTLKYICDKYCEYTGNRIDELSFYNKLKTNGVNFESQVESEYLVQIFDDIFFYVGDIITSINKLYGLNIQNIYFSTDIGEIPRIEMFIEDRLGLIKKHFNFNIALNSKDYDLTQLDTLMMLVAQDNINTKDNEYNYSPYRRPAPVFQRPSGKLISAGLLGLLLAMAYPGYQFGHGYILSVDTEAKTAEYQEAHRQELDIKAKLASLANEIDSTRKANKEQNDILTERNKLLDKMNDKKNNYNMKAVAIYNLSNMLNSKNAEISEIIGGENNLTLVTRSLSDKKITELIQMVSGDKQYSVTTKKIQRYENNQTIGYDSNITVEFNK